MTYDQARQEATRIAREYQEKIYIAECEIYARSEDEYGEGPYIVGSLPVFACMYERLHALGGKVVGVVDSAGNHFSNDLNQVLADFGQ